jgi:3-carboxy-cis,cis-muconate cycloisomerase
MPQKQNPVGPSVLVALARQIIALAPLMTGAGLHRQQRDGAAWFTEWLTLPQLCLSTGKTLALALDLAARITPDAAAMAHALTDGAGTIFAEALTFALAETRPRPTAEAALKALCAEALQTGTDLRTLFTRDHPDLRWQARLAGRMLGLAPDEARTFAALTRAQT